MKPLTTTRDMRSKWTLEQSVPTSRITNNIHRKRLHVRCLARHIKWIKSLNCHCRGFQTISNRCAVESHYAERSHSWEDGSRFATPRNFSSFTKRFKTSLQRSHRWSLPSTTINQVRNFIPYFSKISFNIIFRTMTSENLKNLPSCRRGD